MLRSPFHTLTIHLNVTFQFENEQTFIRMFRKRFYASKVLFEKEGNRLCSRVAYRQPDNFGWRPAQKHLLTEVVVL